MVFAGGTVDGLARGPLRERSDGRDRARFCKICIGVLCIDRGISVCVCGQEVDGRDCMIIRQSEEVLSTARRN